MKDYIKNLEDPQKFFCRVMIRAFGIPAEAAVVKAIVRKENDDNVPTGVLIDKTI